MATAEAGQMSRQTGELIIAYKCYDCPKWHIGHADRTQLIIRNMAGSGLSFCEICDRPIPIEVIDEAGRKNLSLTICSSRCQRKAERHRRASSKSLPPDGPEGYLPASF